MFKYEYEKSRGWAGGGGGGSGPRRALPPPPRAEHCARVPRLPSKPTVPLKVWIVASASCFAVCAALVLATVVITKWGTTEAFSHGRYYEEAAPMYSHPQTRHQAEINEIASSQAEDEIPSVEESDLNFPILGKLSMFKNMVANRDKKPEAPLKPDIAFKSDLAFRQDLASKPQIHPLHDTTVQHQERKIEKKYQPKAAASIPEFKPTLPDVFVNKNLEIKLPDGYFNRYDTYDTDYYNDENLYNDYMESTSMTSYLIEKVQELHDWITTDKDFEIKTNTNGTKPKINEFSQVLKALNESLIEGNVTIIMCKLKELYYGDNNGTNSTTPRRLILSNSTDLLSFGILSLDVMLLHNIQLMAWENQEAARHKMLRDPDVYTFNALFLEPSRVEPRTPEARHQDNTPPSARPGRRVAEEFDLGRNIIENVLEIGMSTARAAIHLGRAYKNTKLVLSQMSNKDNLNSNIQSQLARNVVPNSRALQHLQAFSRNVSTDAATVYTELDCLWLLYCRNLAVTAKLNAPYGLMARINGVALRMLTGELSAERALDTMLTEAVSGWTDLKCNDMFPRCSQVNAASVVMDSILQPLRKSHLANNKIVN